MNITSRPLAGLGLITQGHSSSLRRVTLSLCQTVAHGSPRREQRGVAKGAGAAFIIST